MRKRKAVLLPPNPQQAPPHHSWQTRQHERPGGVPAAVSTTAISRSSRKPNQDRSGRNPEAPVEPSRVGRKLKELLPPTFIDRQNKLNPTIRKESISDPQPIPMALAQAHERASQRPITPVAIRNSTSLDIAQQRELRKSSYPSPLSPLTQARLASRQQGRNSDTLVTEFCKSSHEISCSPEVTRVTAPLAAVEEKARQQWRSREAARSTLDAERAKVDAEAKGGEVITGLGVKIDMRENMINDQHQDGEAYRRWRQLAESKSLKSQSQSQSNSKSKSKSTSRGHFEYDPSSSIRNEEASIRTNEEDLQAQLGKSSNWKKHERLQASPGSPVSPRRQSRKRSVDI